MPSTEEKLATLEERQKHLGNQVDSYHATQKNLRQNLPLIISDTMDPKLENLKKDFKIAMYEVLEEKVADKQAFEELKQEHKRTRKGLVGAMIVAAGALGDSLSGIVKHLPFWN